ncbi:MULTISPECIES: DUF2141 domain-containing protein [unclassified Sphingobium]|uniref:DUF2141 domain-containing protein n=1 Tax=unclassified Sphingobium TaxID=2611147 RepID=UPI000D175490|nr:MULTISPECIES: DUF2141 domain-containing protein [unclassified Sphingobium]MBG6118853.1 uncharacterized protein (DUF2141 family) [Sphingobium sp. JAI105]PSO13527.1 hypothetical protein C7E20_00400 [Sphingobium sp. AEW4]TWD10517.1 uncharacterized protein (DUF2141 family) [Sphingobium sp. AEW010]TWD28078.1 uncharacterized protein (DUF2141 family) [Sphingobium sp. AEW013]TWD28851.1 uncharacterized protein (DUF2141 family) [Sphingobium sp. AEW001]
MKGRAGGLMLLVPLLLGAAPLGQPQPLIMALEGLRSTKGQILVCVTRVPRYFPDCSDDPDKRHFAVAARGGAVTIGNVTPGDYAIAIVHDENGNGKLDTFAGIPREGVGFSRNPVLRFGAPSFRSASFAVAGAPVEQDIRVKYFL